MLFTDFDEDVWKNQEKLLAFFLKKTCIGTDEVGRGCLAGPVVAASVFFPCGSAFFLRDSKKLSIKKREMVSKTILSTKPFVGIAFVHPAVIDRINILNATKLAMKISIGRCLENAKKVLMHRDAILCVDGNFQVPGINSIQQISIVQGDNIIASISAASVLAKVTRDAYMTSMIRFFPGYGFEQNKGYGTPLHIREIKKNGLTPFHRKSFCSGIIDDSH
jgi:ribonuclease HII